MTETSTAQLSVTDADRVVGIRRIASIDGIDVPLTECDWLHIAPCGCACGIAVAEMHGHVLPDADAAMIEFTSTQTKREADRDRTAGFSVRLIRHEEFRQNKDILTIKCPHTPAWGVPPKPKPEGYVWAAQSKFGRRILYSHLAPEKATTSRARDGWPAADDRSAAICGAGDKWSVWYTDDHYTFDTMPCSRCVTLGRKLPAAPAEDAAPAEVPDGT